MSVFLSVFLLLAAGLTALALLFVLWPLLRKHKDTSHQVLRVDLNLNVLKDQASELASDLRAGTIDETVYAASRRELERRVADELQSGGTVADSLKPSHQVQTWPAVILGLFVPALAVGLYLMVGEPAALNPATVAQQDGRNGVTQEQIVGMVNTLAQRLKAQPDDVQGWAMLARSLGALGRFDESVQAYRQLQTRMPENADMLADYADTLAMTQDRTLAGAPEKLVIRALELDPTNLKALSLSGSAAFERRDYKKAIIEWRKILVLVPPESEGALSVMSNISEAQALLDPKSRPQAASTAPTTAPERKPAAEPNLPATGSIALSGVVELDASLRGKAGADDTVFIFARAVDGPKFPLVVLRKQVKDLPYQFTLDDSMSMMPNAKLSSFPTVVVGARISKSGNAMPAAGDLEGLSPAVKLGSKDLRVRIAIERK